MTVRTLTITEQEWLAVDCLIDGLRIRLHAMNQDLVRYEPHSGHLYNANLTLESLQRLLEMIRERE